MRKLLTLVVVVAVAAGAAAYVWHTSPPWFERIRYPLHYSESKFRADAESSSGAIGLMQLTPSTARGIAIRTGGSRFRTNDLYNPEINIRYGAWYLGNLFQKYGSERLVLAAYNAGQGNVDAWRAKGEAIQFPETRAYVHRVEHLKHVYRKAWASELGYQ